MTYKEKSLILEYFVLVMILFIGLYSLLILRNFKAMQIFSILIMSFAYIMWGVAHHTKEKTLHLKIVIEYTILSIAVSILLIFLLNLTH